MKISARTSLRLLTCSVVLISSASLAQAPATYRITQNFAVRGDGRWDYVIPDAARHRVFIRRQNRVMVIDANSGMLLGEVTGINGALGGAVAMPSGHGLATSATTARW